MTDKWIYLIVKISNNGRTIHENGVLVKSHTKKANLSKLPKTDWNKKGRRMTEEAKGAILNSYGLEGWELVSAQLDAECDNNYIFKQKL